MLYVLLAAILAVSGLVMFGLAVGYTVPASEPYRIRPAKKRRLGGFKLYGLVLLNSLMSVALLFGVCYLGFEHLFYEGGFAYGTFALEIVGILLLYDFVYYLAHRFLLHGPIKPLYRIHVLHHTANNPQAQDSLYVHPLETLMGLTLLLFSTWIIGPVHVVSFAVMFGIYSFMNIVIHGGLKFPVFPFRFLGYMAQKHDTHHKSLKSGNYASITPVFDILFGTKE